MKTSTSTEDASPLLFGITNAVAGHLLLRLALGINILGHGLVRIGNPGAFADALVQLFANTGSPRRWSASSRCCCPSSSSSSARCSRSGC
ncbi:hypothetical protein ACN28S_15015 [Cystobacter fuscus]